jgi:lysophospholipase L1-like esterase
MITNGKTIICIGASNTRIIVDENGRHLSDMNYPTMLGLRLRARVRNFGVSGSNITPCDERTDSYIERVEQIDGDCDIVLLQGEGNDAVHGIPLGEAGDATPDTYTGAVRTLIRKLKQKFEGKTLIVLSGMKKKRAPVRTDGRTHDDFHRAFVQVCESEGALLVDFYTDEVLDPTNPEYMPDGVHMSERACMYYADKLSDIIRSL